MRAIAAVGRFGIFLGRFTRASLTHPPPIRRAMVEAWEVGVAALPLLIVIAAFVGTNLAVQGHAAFTPIGGQRMVGLFVGLTGVREFAPIIAGSMVAAKSGTQMASEIAIMRTREEIDALEVMGVQPHWYLVTPRFLGIILAMPAVTILTTAVIFTAAWAVANFQLDLNPSTFIEFAESVVSPRDLLLGVFKGTLFGAVISLVSTYNGFYSDPGPDGVGESTNRAVVLSAVGCNLLNFLISQAVYG